MSKLVTSRLWCNQWRKLENSEATSSDEVLHCTAGETPTSGPVFFKRVGDRRQRAHAGQLWDFASVPFPFHAARAVVLQNVRLLITPGFMWERVRGRGISDTLTALSYPSCITSSLPSYRELRKKLFFNDRIVLFIVAAPNSLWNVKNYTEGRSMDAKACTNFNFSLL